MNVLTRLENVKCKICSAPVRHLCTTIKDYVTGSTIQHYRCPMCGLIFGSPNLRGRGLRNGNRQSSTPPAQQRCPAPYEIQRRPSRESSRGAISPKQQLSAAADTQPGELSQLLLGTGFLSIAVREVPRCDFAHLEIRGVYPLRNCDYRSFPNRRYDVVSLSEFWNIRRTQCLCLLSAIECSSLAGSCMSKSRETPSPHIFLRAHCNEFRILCQCLCNRGTWVEVFFHFRGSRTGR